jgi:hypothetical protein
MDIAVKSARARPPIDLRALLAGRISRERVPQALKALRFTAINATWGGRNGNLVIARKDESADAATVSFFDIMVEGHQQFTVSFQPTGCKDCEVTVVIRDQVTGDALCDVSKTASSGEELVIESPFDGMYGLFCLVLHIFPGGDGAGGISIDRMQIE